MAKFTTANGQAFTLKITIPKIKAVRDELGVDIGIMEEFIGLAGDLPKFVDCLYLLCEKRCNKLGWSDEEFGESLCGDSLEDAWNAFEKAYVSFCPSRRRATVKAAFKKIHQAVEEMEAATLSALAMSSEECSE